MRNYIVSSWNDADQYNYSGEQIGNRQRKSGRVHFNPDGSACVASYSDDEPKVSKVSIKDKILPQGKRLQTLRSQMIELETAYRAGEMDISEYSILRDCVVAKLQRAEVLYKRAIAAKPIKTEDEYEVVGVETTYSSSDVEYTDTPIATSSWLDDLSDKNSLKKPMKKALQVAKTLVRWHNRTKAYIQTLKEV